METFTKEKLCLTAYGGKVHIRKGNQTYCGRGGLFNLEDPGLIGMTEKAKELCKVCLRVFKASKQ